MLLLFSFCFLLLMGITPLRAQDASSLVYKIDGKECAYPRLSKDGRRILYQSNHDGRWQLYIMDRTSGNHSPLMSDPHNNNFPDWSRDNAWIAFTSDRDGNEEIYLMQSDGKHLRRITTDPGRDIHPYFSPDGKYLLFNSTRGNGSFDIYRYTLADSTLHRLSDTPQNETCARYSPDMKQIVYLKNDASSDDVFLADAANQQARNLTQTPFSTDGWPAFSPDGQWIYWSSQESGIYHIYRIRTDGSSKQKLTRAAAGEEDARVCLATDNSFFIYNKRYGSTIEIREMRIS